MFKMLSKGTTNMQTGEPQTNKDKCLFRFISVLFSSEVISTHLCIVDYHSTFPVIKRLMTYPQIAYYYHIKLFFRIWSTQENNVRHMQ